MPATLTDPLKATSAVLRKYALPLGEASGSLARRADEVVAMPYFEEAQRRQRAGGPARGGANFRNMALMPCCGQWMFGDDAE